MTFASNDRNNVPHRLRVAFRFPTNIISFASDVVGILPFRRQECICSGGKNLTFQVEQAST
jgi:hypothetical protein